VIALRPRRGFALAAVLWALVVLGSLAIHFHDAARADRFAILNARAEAQARWAARAGLAHSLAAIERRLASYSPLDGYRMRGDTLVPPSRTFAHRVPVTTVVLDHHARLNLNTVEEAALMRFLRGLGIPLPDAVALHDAILDWRDPDDIPRPRGAEASYYASLRPPITPRNGPFQSVAELRSVRGVTPDVYRTLEPHLTVDGDGLINVNTASQPVLLALPGIDALTAASIIRRRSRAPYANVYEIIAELSAPARRDAQERAAELLSGIAFAPRTIAVIARAEPAGGALGAELRATVQLLGGPAVSIISVAERPLSARSPE
jgi:general secretion pathway protein K